MENLVILAGTAIGLLGTFLFVSERELRKKQRECEDLRGGKCGPAMNPPAGAQFSETVSSGQIATNNEAVKMAPSLSVDSEESQRTLEELQTERDLRLSLQSENQRLAAEKEQLEHEIAQLDDRLQNSENRLHELIGDNQEAARRNSNMQAELFALKHQLQSSEKMIEALQAEQQSLGDAEVENEQLQQEIANLRNELQTSEARLGESARETDQAGDRCARLEAEASNLKQQLEESHAKVRELEVAAEQQAANFESRETTLRNQQQKLEDQVTQLQQELSAERCRVQELETAQQRLAEMEHACEQLREENRRLALQSTPDPIELTPESIASSVPHPNEEIAFETALTPSTVLMEVPGSNNGHALSSGGDAGAETHTDNEEKTKLAVLAPARRRWRLGIVAAMVVVTLAGAVAVGFLDISPERFFGSKEASLAPEMASTEQSAAVDSSSDESKKSAPASVTASGKNALPKEKPATKPAAHLQGAFKITRPTQVYSAPSENAEPIVSVQPGVKINVVDSRDGWLEIRSKHGRPPGYVRQEAAVRMD